METPTHPDRIVDFITGHNVPNIGAEANRQSVERFLVEKKGYARHEISVDAPIEIEIDGAPYRSAVDLVVTIDDRPLIAVKCAAGSLASREREVISAARLFAGRPLPLAVASDGRDAIVYDALRGEKRGQGLDAIPDRTDAAALARSELPPPLTAERLTRMKRVFRSYDSMNVNRQTG